MRRILLATAAALLCAAPLAAQKDKDQKEPKRPKLTAGADTNDAKAYFDWGMRDDVPWKDAYNAFYWANRIEPSDPTYLYALYLAMWRKQSPEWRNEYYQEAEYIMKSKEARQIDSLYNEALIRDPFAHLYYDRCLRPDWIDGETDDLYAAAVLEGRNCYKDAAQRYQSVLTRKPALLGTRFSMARALYFVGDYSGTVAQLDTLLTQMRARDQKRLNRIYQTKTMFEYMAGHAFARQRNWDAAREAYGRALSEDLAFYMAHSALAKVALAQGDVATAVQELDQAVQLRGDDAALRMEYGVALMEAARHADAEVQLRKALELNPHFATAYFNLAASLDHQGKSAEALDTYRQFLARAPKRAVVLGVKAGGRVKALQAAPNAATAKP